MTLQEVSPQSSEAVKLCSPSQIDIMALLFISCDIMASEVKFSVSVSLSMKEDNDFNECKHLL